VIDAVEAAVVDALDGRLPVTAHPVAKPAHRPCRPGSTCGLHPALG
jgi:hypothetical protein